MRLSGTCQEVLSSQARQVTQSSGSTSSEGSLLSLSSSKDHVNLSRVHVSADMRRGPLVLKIRTGQDPSTKVYKSVHQDTPCAAHGQQPNKSQVSVPNSTFQDKVAFPGQPGESKCTVLDPHL